jgi:ribonucleoside-diphosphate reductase subunit M1
MSFEVFVKDLCSISRNLPSLLSTSLLSRLENIFKTIGFYYLDDKDLFLNRFFEVIKNLFVEEPILEDVARDLLLRKIYQTSPSSFIEYYNTIKHLLSEKAIETVEKYKNELSNYINEENDLNFDFIGLDILFSKYLLKIQDVVIERPQYLFMRVSLMAGDLDSIKLTYNHLSTFKIMVSTPILYNASLKNGQLSACFILRGPSTREAILDNLTHVCNISKTSGGIAIDVSNVPVDIFDEYISYLDKISLNIKQEGKRNTSICISTWLWDIKAKDVLALRAENNTSQMFSAVMVPDLFMKRMKICGNWSFMKPGTFNNLFGDEFERKYLEEEKLNHSIKVMKAIDVWNFMLKKMINSGNPNVLFSDTINKFNNEKMYGNIFSSNLCTEIMQHAEENKPSVCTLGSLGLDKFIYKNKFDFDLLETSVDVLHDLLIKSISLTTFPVPKEHPLKTRSLGIGVRGLADLFIKLEYPYESDHAQKLNKQIFEAIYYYAMEASINYSKKTNFNGYEKIFHFDYYGDKVKLEYDWDILRNSPFPLYSSLLVALAPTSTTAKITNSSESFEPIKYLVQTTKVLSGNYQTVNKQFYKKMIDLKLWDKIKENIRKNDINLLEIPDFYKSIFKSAYDINQSTYIKMAADRAPFIDQSQSLNLFMKDVENLQTNLSKHLIEAWHLKLKTGCYYLHIQSQDPIKCLGTSNKECSECNA